MYLYFVVMKSLFLKSILFIVLLGSCIYAICYYCNLLKYAQAINFLLYASAAIIGGFSLLVNRWIIFNFSFALVGSTFLWMFLSGIFQNSISQVLPSACRYFAYLIFANLSYLYVLQNGVDAFIRINKKFLVYFVILSLFWGIVEIISGDIDYLNGAYRFAGSFKKHQLATALFIYVLLVLYREFFLKHKKKIFSFCIYFILLGFLVATQSRAVLGIFFIVHFLYYLFRVRSIRKLISLAAGAILVIGIIYYAIVYTDFMPRYKTMLIGDKGIYDASTLERLDIMYNSIDNLKGEHKIWGIGLGGFEAFYHSITGREDVAAHNNYLLFYTDGGYIALGLYLLFQLVLGLNLIRNIRKRPGELARPTFMLFFGITVMSFLLNNYYFYCSELLVWSFIGGYLAERKYEKNIVFSAK